MPSVPYPYAWAPPPRRATFGSIVSGMFDVWTKGFKDFFLVFLVLGLVNGTLGALLVYAVFGVFAPPTGFLRGSPPPNITTANLGNLVIFGILVALAGIILNSVVGGGMTEYSVRKLRGEAITLEHALRRGLEKFPSIFGPQLLTGLLVFAVFVTPLLLLLPVASAGPTFDPTSAIGAICGALAIFVVGGLIVLFILVATSLYAPSIMIENVNAVGGLKRSWRLTKGHWWSIFVALLVVFILFVIIDRVIQAATDVLNNAIVSIVTYGIVIGIAGAWTLITAAVAYDLIVREQVFPAYAPPYYPGPAMGSPPASAQGPPTPPPPAPPRGP